MWENSTCLEFGKFWNCKFGVLTIITLEFFLCWYISFIPTPRWGKANA